MSNQLDVEVDKLQSELRETARCLEAYRKENDDAIRRLVDALDRLWTYAAIGASVSDVSTREQPEFVNARALLAEFGRARR